MKLEKYKKEDFYRLKWDEYGETLEALNQKVERYFKNNEIKIDVIVPIMRGGLFPGNFLAYQLGILKIVPVQYKYFFEGKKIVLRRIKKLEIDNIPKDANILVVEQDHCFGNTGKEAVMDIKRALPNSKVFYATDYMDYSYQDVIPAEKIFYGKLDNHTKALSNKQAKEKKVSTAVFIFPWENMEEEWDTVNSKQFKYVNIDDISKNSKKIIEF